MRRNLIITAVALSAVLSALTLSGCTADGRSASSSADSAAGPSVVAPGTTSGAATSLDTATGTSRQVVTTGTATITTSDPAKAAGAAVTIVETSGGRIDAQKLQAPVDGDRGSASVSLRIPSAKLTAVLDRITNLGRVEKVELSTDDVTRQSEDLTARITAQRASVDRLIALLAAADTTKDLIALENAVSDRQGNLEAMEAKQRSLVDQVSLSRVDVSFVSVADAPARAPSTFWSGLSAGWESFVGFVIGAVVVFGVVLPWLAFLAFLGAVVLVLVRTRRRRAAARA
jgi:hypothetical protein